MRRCQTFFRRELLAIIASLLALSDRPVRAEVKLDLRDRLRHDVLRPQFHLLPPANWMNDPCGPIYVDHLYHLFYQYNPDAPTWGNIHWGHASSCDMIHWQHEPIALSPIPGWPDSKGVFTGSVVLDDGVPTAIFTAVPEGGCCRAVSDRTLRLWDQDPYPLDLQHPQKTTLVGFRDPQVWGVDGAWSLVIGSGIKGRGGAVFRYQSTDLLHWKYQGLLYLFLESSQEAKTCECPDFFLLSDRSVLLFSASAASYFVLGYDVNGKFTPEASGVIDHGPLYAVKSMLDSRGRRILWGWIRETRPVKDQVASGWSGVMSLPRVLSLSATGRLRVDALPEIDLLEGQIFVDSAKGIQGQVDGPAARIRATAIGAGRLVFGGRAAFVDVNYDPQRTGRELICNGIVSSLEVSAYAHFDIVVDASVVEIFCNDGTCLTARAYGDAAGPLQVRWEGGFVDGGVRACEMMAISRDRLTSEMVP